MELIHKIFNVETGETIERPFTEEELAHWEAVKQQSEMLKAQEQERVNARQALLEKLGITEQEAKLLLS